MERVFNDEDVDPRVRRVLRKLGRDIIGVAGYTEDEVDDIVQDLILHLLTHPIAIDPERGSMVGVVCTVARHKRSHMVASRCAAKRNHGKPPVSLSDRASREREDTRTHEEIYDMDTYLNRTGRSERTVEELGDLSLDVERLLDDLPTELRRIAELLMYYRKSEVAKMLGIPWGTFCDKCRELRLRMRRMNLNEYAESSGKSRRDSVLRK